MATAALSFHGPHPIPSAFPSTQKNRPPWCPESLPRIRKQVACSADPPFRRPPDEDKELRAEISPSVLRSLQSPDPSSSARISSGESLIERNLRKRKQASSPSSSMEESVPASPLSDGHPAGFPERQTSSAEQDWPSDKGSSPSSGGGDDRSRHSSTSSSAITSVFWQARPRGCDMEAFRSIDHHAYYFRQALVCYAVMTEPAYTKGLSAFSFFWLLSPMQALSIPFLEETEDLTWRWKRDGSVKFGKITENDEALTAATMLFSYLQSSKAWMARVASGKATELAMALAYSTYVYILAGAADESSNFAKKLEKYSALLTQSLAQLHGLPLDPIAVWEKTLKDASFALDGRVFVYDDAAIIFPCKLKSSRDPVHFGPVLEAVQSCLNKEFKSSDLVALLHRSSESHEEFFILIAPWYWVLSVDSKQYAPGPALLCALSCLAVSQFPGAGLGFGFAWEQNVAILGWTSIVASLYIANNMRFPALFPFPSFGALGCLLPDYGMVSSRSSLIRAVLKNACAPLAISLLLLICGWVFWGPSQYHSASVADLRGYVLVSPDLFSHSAILSKLLQDASVEAIQGDDLAPKLAASPIVLAGLLGLNFTAFTLFPGLRTNGGYLLKGILKSKGLANQLNCALTVLLTIILCTKNPLLGLAWQLLSVITEADCFVRDDVSDTDPVSNLAGIVLVVAAITCFIPPLL